MCQCHCNLISEHWNLNCNDHFQKRTWAKLCSAPTWAVASASIPARCTLHSTCAHHTSIAYFMSILCRVPLPHLHHRSYTTCGTCTANKLAVRCCVLLSLFQQFGYPPIAEPLLTAYRHSSDFNCGWCGNKCVSGDREGAGPQSACTNPRIFFWMAGQCGPPTIPHFVSCWLLADLHLIYQGPVLLGLLRLFSDRFPGTPRSHAPRRTVHLRLDLLTAQMLCKTSRFVILHTAPW